MSRALALVVILAVQLALAGLALNDGAVDFSERSAAAATVGSTTTATATGTATITPATTLTPTASATPTVASTPTVTQTATATPNSNALSVPATTPSPHPTIPPAFPTFTPTRTPTASLTPTRTPTASLTPTRTPTPRATTTITITPTTTLTPVPEPLRVLGVPLLGGSTSTSTTISWTTNLPGTGQVRYGPTVAYGATTGLDSVADSEHRHILAGLQPATLYHYRVETVDAAGNRMLSPDAMFVTNRRGERGAVDDVIARRITSTTAQIGWTASTSVAQVEYGINPTYGLFTLLQVFPSTNQQIVLNNLLPQTLYHYRIRTWDATGASTTTSDFTFATASPRTATLLGNALPDERHTVIPGGEAYAFQYTAAASGLATQLRLFVDTFGGTQGVALALYADQAGKPGDLLGQGAVQRLVPASWNTVILPATSLTRGTTYWIAVLNPAGAAPLGVRGATGNGTSRQAAQPALNAFPLSWVSGPVQGTTALSVYAVQQAPMITLNEPNDGSMVSGQVNLSAIVDDDAPIVSVQFVVDDLPIGPADSATPFTAVWDSSQTTTHDFHTVSARVTDALGRVATAAPVWLHVDNGAAFTQVAATPAGPASVWITWSTDTISDSQVEFGALATYGQATLDPNFVWQHRVQLTGLRPGAVYHFRVKSRDLRGMLGASGDFTFTAPPET